MYKGLKTVIRSFITPAHVIDAAIAAIILLMLYLLSEKNFLLFHGIIELISIAISFSIFILVWNTRKLFTDSFFLFIGISFLFTGTIDLIHTLAYKGMGVFPGFTADLPTQLWIAARYFQSITFLIATLFIGKTITKNRKYDAAIIFAACAAFCALFLASIFFWQDFPHCFIEGSGLTPFKIYSEYIISFILIATAVILYIRRRLFDSEVWRFLIAAQLFLIMGELSFTTYVSVYGFTNMLGHLFKLVSFYFFYRAIIVVGLTRPYDLILRDLVENINDVIFTTDTQGKITYISPAVERMCGYTAEEMTGQNLIRYVHPEDHPPFTGAMQPEENGLNKETEFRIIRRDGIVREIRNVSRPTITGRDAGFTNIMTDITKRKKAENDLRKSEEQYRSLFENAAEGIIFADLESMKFINVNPSICRMLGYSEDELLSMGVPDIHPEKDRDHVFSEFRALVTGKITMTKNIPCLCKDKTIRLMDITSSSVTGNGKKFIIGLFTDATERCNAEVALRKSEYKLNAIVRGSPIPQFVIDAGHRITHWNDAIEKYSGIKAEEVIGTNRQWRAFYPDERPCLADLLVDEAAEQISEWYPGKSTESKLIEGAYEATDFFPQMRESGVWLYFTATAIRDDEDRIIGAVETLIDITEQKKAEEALRDALTEKDVLLLEIHHRVKNNLAVIISLMEMQTESISDEHVLKMVRNTQGRIAVMAQVHQLLYDSKNVAQINFGDFLNNLSYLLMQSYGRKQLIEVQVGGENLPVSLDVAIPAGLIVNELVTNAIVHAFPEDQPPAERADQPCRITISFNLSGDEYTLVVSDNGIGIPPDFDLQSARTLGLRLVNILAQHQLRGTINMNTTKGTEFVIKFRDPKKRSEPP